MYFPESDNYVSENPDTAEFISKIDQYLAAKFNSFFDLPTAELFTDIDSEYLPPYLDYYIEQGVLVREERIKCDYCEQTFRLLGLIENAVCDLCEFALNRASGQVYEMFRVVREPRAKWSRIESPVDHRAKLTGQELGDICTGILKGFSPDDFKSLLRFSLDLKLTDIASEQVSFPVQVLNVLEHLNNHNRVRELIAAVRKNNPNDDNLRLLEERFCSP